MSTYAPHECWAMAMLFEVCLHRREPRWLVLIEGQFYGEYIDKVQALLDAIDAAKDALATGQEAEVWDQDGGKRVY